jgi:hypothetical protein
MRGTNGSHHPLGRGEKDNGRKEGGRGSDPAGAGHPTFLCPVCVCVLRTRKYKVTAHSARQTCSTGTDERVESERGRAQIETVVIQPSPQCYDLGRCCFGGSRKKEATYAGVPSPLVLSCVVVCVGVWWSGWSGWSGLSRLSRLFCLWDLANLGSL